ncbi:ATP-dependent DNA helicase II subunit 2 [Penicillium subrubescens]|uniref:ATP-dependent DNA helicase II subunit 2 n=1 Tax=Penicillium subrubescens TaxID=1316194 RepID=UPI00254522F1|nr:ATP-dependent DNA helicase II subunit 2 [Penicillium subrubescens]KAJ5891195.1 ATP-dependent DNA helicase II subunit 2 [Penicillium subrubescens]
MADKEATVYIVDVGKSMGERRHGRSVTDLEWAMKYVWDRITATVATGRKTATIGVVALRSDETSNELREDTSFSKISVLRNLGQFLMADIRQLREAIKPSQTNKGDAVSSVVVAIQMINTYTKKLKYKRRIVLVTNGTGHMNNEGLDEIQRKIQDDGIELVVLGADFDDPEFGVKEEDKDLHKAENETLLQVLAEGCGGVFGTLEQAISELEIPRIKITKSMPSFKGFLSLGDASKYETALRIPVERYFRTYVAKPPSASSFALRSGGQEENEAGAGQSTSGGEALTTIRTSRTYQINDESAPGGKVDVERDDLAKGYEYGRTAVHISQTDENITTLETFAGMEIIGFVQMNKYDRYLHMSNTNVIIPQKANDKASLALSSLIHALWEQETYAVARLVAKEAKPPIIVLLAPSIEPDYECLIEIALPFAEDVRSYRFPPLDKVVTVSGKIVTEHRNLPTEDLQQAMNDYVDSMELDGEELPIDDSYSPLLHRIDTAVRYRAVYPNEPILEPSEQLTKFAHPDKELVREAKDSLEKLMSTANVKKVPPKTKGRKRLRETEKPLSGLDVDALLKQEPKRTKISAENAIPEFKQMLSRADSIEIIHDAVKQMTSIIETQIKHSLGDANYDRVVEGLGTMREELVDFEEPTLYNDYLAALKGKILGDELGGDRNELWWLIRKSKLGLIDQATSEVSKVTEDEAKEFFSAS